LQGELLTDQFLREPRVTMVLTNAARLGDSVDRLSRATQSASQTAAQLPDRITAERKAILDALEAQEGKLRELSAELGRTLAAGEQMSTSLNTTLTTFDALMKRFGVGETNVSSEVDTNSEPFRVRDYTDAAAQITIAAQRLTELLARFDETLGSTNLTRLGPMVAEAETGGKAMLDYAFRRAVIFAVICAVLFLVTGLIHRAASGRARHAREGSPRSSPMDKRT